MATQNVSNPNWRKLRPNNRQNDESKQSSIQCNTTRPDLRLNVFVSKEGTNALANIILREPWGPEHENLYKLMDYTWRAALFNDQIFRFDSKGKEFVVFHSGLQRRMDGEFIYFVLVRNDDDSKVQKWRIASSPSAEWSFKTAVDLLQFVDGERSRLPQRTKFYVNPSEILFDTSAVINVDWVRMTETCRERIIKDIVEEILILDDATNAQGSLLHVLPPRNTASSINFAIQKLRERKYHVPGAGEIRANLVSAFEKAEKIVRANPSFIVPQGFVDTNKRECRLELLLPLFVEFDVSVDKIEMCFCVALQREQTYNGYKGMSVLTADMAYTNARLVGVVHQSWLLAAAWPQFYTSPWFSRPRRKAIQSVPAIVHVPQATLQRSAPPRFTRGRVTESNTNETRNRSLFVRNIPRSWTEDLIRKKFGEIGPVNRLTMLPNRKKGSDKLLCLIEMRTPSDAVTVIRTFHSHDDDDGIKVEPARGPRNVVPTKSNPRFGATMAGTSVSLPPTIASQKLTLEIRNIKHHQTATTFLELLKFANLSEDEMLWLIVYQPENYALVRFKTPDQIERAHRIFATKAEFGYTCRKIRNPPLSSLPNESFWKIAGGEKLSASLSARLDAAAIGHSFFENPHDERSAQIVRYSDSQGSWRSPDTNASVPLLRVQISSWRAHNRWTNSRLRRRLPVAEEKALNPHATVFDPTCVDMDEEMEEEAHRSGAMFVPHDNHLEVARGSVQWNGLQNHVTCIRGLDIASIFEWPLKVLAPTTPGLERQQLWFAGHPKHVGMLENEGFMRKYGDSGSGRRKSFTMFGAPNVALDSISEPGTKREVNLVLCDVFLTQAEKKDLSDHGCVRVIGDSLSGCVDSIVPKFVFHTSQRRVGRN